MTSPCFDCSGQGKVLDTGKALIRFPLIYKFHKKANLVKCVVCKGKGKVRVSE